MKVTILVIEDEQDVIDNILEAYRQFTETGTLEFLKVHTLELGHSIAVPDVPGEFTTWLNALSTAFYANAIVLCDLDLGLKNNDIRRSELEKKAGTTVTHLAKHVRDRPRDIPDGILLLAVILKNLKHSLVYLNSIRKNSALWERVINDEFELLLADRQIVIASADEKTSSTERALQMLSQALLSYGQSFDSAIPKRRVLIESINVGSGIAEHETTDADLTKWFSASIGAWKRLLGTSREYPLPAEIITGPKGSGKSMLYLQLVNAAEKLRRDRNELVVPSRDESDRDIGISDALAFCGAKHNLHPDEAKAIWKICVAMRLLARLEHSGEDVQSPVGLSELLQEWAVKSPQSVPSIVRQGFRKILNLTRSMKVDGPVKVDLSDTDVVKTTVLIQLGNRVEEELTVWSNSERIARLKFLVCFEQLDQQYDGERRALVESLLSGLILLYKDWNRISHATAIGSTIRFKIFLRSDIWYKISRGLAEISHIDIVHARLEWTSDSLRSLLIKRMQANYNAMRLLGVEIIDDDSLDRFLCKPFEKLIQELADGNNVVLPREIIQYVLELRTLELLRLDAESTVPSQSVFEPAIAERAVYNVAQKRWVTTILPENPELASVLDNILGCVDEHFKIVKSRLAVTPEQIRQLQDIGVLKGDGLTLGSIYCKLCST